MGRLIAVLALLACAGVADAKTLIVGGTTDKNDALYGVGDAACVQSRVNQITRILDAFGASYVVIPIEAMRTEWARSGTVTWDFGSSAARTESFDAVIHASFTLSSSARDYATKYRPESLSVVSKLPVVPQLFLGSNDARAGINDDGLIFQTTTACSLGVAASKAIEGAGGGSGTHDEEGVYYQHDAFTDVFCGTEIVGRQVTNAATVVGKGYRTLLAHGSGPLGVHHQGLSGWLVWSAQWDSTGRRASPDTAEVWMIQNTHSSGKKPIIVCPQIGAGLTDAAGGLIGTAEEVDLPMLMAGLAALDSASGGLVFDNKDKLPLRVAITVDGLCSRSIATNSGGIVPTDTTRFYATLDSLQTLAVPIVFGVNIDSVATYPRDLQYAKDAIGRARFSPQGRLGIDSTAAGNGPANSYQIRDAFRRYRNAAVVVGVTGRAAGDTSLYALLHYAVLKGDSLWPGRSSRFALPVDDDWSPYNLGADQSGPTVDSVLYAYRKAGFKGIRINGSWAASRPNKTRNNPRGYIAEHGAQTIRYGTTEKGNRFK